MKLIYAKNDIKSLRIFVDNYVGTYKNEDYYNIQYLINNNKWEMLVIIHNSNIFQKLAIHDLVRSSNVDAIDKFLEYGFIKESEIKNMLKHEQYLYMSSIMQIELKTRYQKYIAKNSQVQSLEKGIRNEFSMEVFNVLYNLIDEDYDGDIITRCGLNIEKYNLLVQKIPSETIINSIINSKYYNFDPAIIDILGIRVRLQE